VLAQATPAPSQELNALLTHPLMLVFATLLAAWVASRILYEQVRQMGLEREDEPEGFGWTSLFSALGFWTVLTLGLLGIAAHTQLLVVSKFLQTAFDMLLRALLVGAVLAATAALARAFTQTDADSDPELARRRRSGIFLVGGALAVVAALGLSFGTWMILAVIGIPGAILVRSAAARAWAQGRVLDAVAGVHLRGQFHNGDTIGEGEQSAEVAGKIGILSTWVRREERLRLEGNEGLLALTRATESQPAPAAPETQPAETTDDADDAGDENDA
jgi:hypothetical protein